MLYTLNEYYAGIIDASCRNVKMWNKCIIKTLTHSSLALYNSGANLSKPHINVLNTSGVCWYVCMYVCMYACICGTPG